MSKNIIIPSNILTKVAGKKVITVTNKSSAKSYNLMLRKLYSKSNNNRGSRWYSIAIVSKAAPDNIFKKYLRLRFPDKVIDDTFMHNFTKDKTEIVKYLRLAGKCTGNNVVYIIDYFKRNILEYKLTSFVYLNKHLLKAYFLRKINFDTFIDNFGFFSEITQEMNALEMSYTDVTLLALKQYYIEERIENPICIKVALEIIKTKNLKMPIASNRIFSFDDIGHNLSLVSSCHKMIEDHVLFFEEVFSDYNWLNYCNKLCTVNSFVIPHILKRNNMTIEKLLEKISIKSACLFVYVIKNTSLDLLPLDILVKLFYFSRYFSIEYLGNITEDIEPTPLVISYTTQDKLLDTGDNVDIYNFIRGRVEMGDSLLKYAIKYGYYDIFIDILTSGRDFSEKVVVWALRSALSHGYLGYKIKSKSENKSKGTRYLCSYRSKFTVNTTQKSILQIMKEHREHSLIIAKTNETIRFNMLNIVADVCINIKNSDNTIKSALLEISKDVIENICTTKYYSDNISAIENRSVLETEYYNSIVNILCDNVIVDNFFVYCLLINRLHIPDATPFNIVYDKDLYNVYYISRVINPTSINHFSHAKREQLIAENYYEKCWESYGVSIDHYTTKEKVKKNKKSQFASQCVNNFNNEIFNYVHKNKLTVNGYVLANLSLSAWQKFIETSKTTEGMKIAKELKAIRDSIKKQKLETTEKNSEEEGHAEDCDIMINKVDKDTTDVEINDNKTVDDITDTKIDYNNKATRRTIIGGRLSYLNIRRVENRIRNKHAAFVNKIALIRKEYERTRVMPKKVKQFDIIY